MAGARTFVSTLNAELKDKGVDAGTVTIGASIERSGMRRAMKASGHNLEGFPSISPGTSADEVWTLVTKRDRLEVVLPPLPTACPPLTRMAALLRKRRLGPQRLADRMRRWP